MPKKPKKAPRKRKSKIVPLIQKSKLKTTQTSIFFGIISTAINISENPAPGENLAARLNNIKDAIALALGVKSQIESGTRFKWGSGINPISGQKTSLTNRKASTILTPQLARLGRLKTNTESLLKTQASLAATTIEPGTGNRRGDGNCYIQTINIGQGDCTTITSPQGKIILVDMGSDSITDIKLNWIGTIPSDVSKIVYPILFSDLKRNIGIGTSSLVHMLILSHTDGDHHNKLHLLGTGMKFGRVYHSGRTISEYVGSSNYIWQRTPKGGIKRVDLLQSQSSGNIIKQVAGVTPKIQARTNIPGAFDNEYIDSTTGAIVLYEEANGFKVSVLASNVDGVFHDFDQGKGSQWVTDDALLKTAQAERNLKLDATVQNKRSLVVFVEFNKSKAIITGDATAVTESFMYQQKGYDSIWDSLYLYRMPHHASPTSSAVGLVSKLTNLHEAVASTSGHHTVLHRLPKNAILNLYTTTPLKNTHQIWSFNTGPSGAKKQIAFNNSTFATGSNGTRFYMLAKP